MNVSEMVKKGNPRFFTTVHAFRFGALEAMKERCSVRELVTRTKMKVERSFT